MPLLSRHRPLALEHQGLPAYIRFVPQTFDDYDLVTYLLITLLSLFTDTVSFSFSFFLSLLLSFERVDERRTKNCVRTVGRFREVVGGHALREFKSSPMRRMIVVGVPKQRLEC